MKKPPQRRWPAKFLQRTLRNTFAALWSEKRGKLAAAFMKLPAGFMGLQGDSWRRLWAAGAGDEA